MCQYNLTFGASFEEACPQCFSRQGFDCVGSPRETASTHGSLEMTSLNPALWMGLVAAMKWATSVDPWQVELVQG